MGRFLRQRHSLCPDHRLRRWIYKIDYKSYDELDMMHDGHRSKRSITYCGGGVAAASLAFTMFRLGYTDVAVYMGSLQEWVTNPENPMTVGTTE